MKKALEGIAKLALGTKFDDFFAQAVFRKLTYMVECRQFAKKRPARKKREFGPKWSFAIPSVWRKLHMRKKSLKWVAAIILPLLLIVPFGWKWNVFKSCILHPSKTG